LRVIAGSARGHKLKAPEGMETRPTTDRIKETLFNMIAYELPGCNFLDLYSGSGGIGIEALSRGADKAVFVDESNVCKKIIEENLVHTKLNAKAVIYQKEVKTVLDQLGQTNEKFDIVFMDPPYGKQLIEETLEKIKKNDLLTSEGFVIVERATNKSMPEIKDMVLWKEKKYKTTTMTFLRRLEETT
jgi:16S rRNA (guanine(966)-N(2))-methyltransferase RsmD